MRDAPESIGIPFQVKYVVEKFGTIYITTTLYLTFIDYGMLLLYMKVKV